MCLSTVGIIVTDWSTQPVCYSWEHMLTHRHSPALLFTPVLHLSKHADPLSLANFLSHVYPPSDIIPTNEDTGLA